MVFVCKDRGDIACGLLPLQKDGKRIHPDVIEVRAELTKDGNENEIGVNVIRDIVKMRLLCRMRPKERFT